MPSNLIYGEICLTKLKIFTFLRWNLYERYPKDFKFQNSEYRGHQVGPNDSGSLNFIFLAFKGESVHSKKNPCNLCSSLNTEPVFSKLNTKSTIF
jgi:hypothetical protein